MLEKIEKHHTKILIVILFIAFLARILFITKVPEGIHEDEAGMAYDAYCISKYGVDRYLNHFPVYLINFGGGQSALYAYITALLIKLLGFSVFVIRIPAVLFSMLAILCSYFVVKKLSGTKLALLFTLLLSIYPWHIIQARWGLDCNLLSSFIAIDLFLLLYSSKKLHYLITGIMIGLTFYTYALSYILIPCFFAILFIYLLYIKKITIKNILVMFIPIFILGLPLFITQIVNILGTNTIDLGWISFPRMLSYRSAEFSFSNVLHNLDITKSNSLFRILIGYPLENIGFETIYLFLIPIILYGLLLSTKHLILDIQKKELSSSSLFFIQFTTIFICLLFFADLQLHKINAILIPYLYFSVVGLANIAKKSNIILVFIIAILFIHFGLFIYEYFNLYNPENNITFNHDLIPLIQYVNSKEEYSQKKIHIESDGVQQYIYTLLAEKTSPYDFFKSAKFYEFGYNTFEVTSYGKYTFLFYPEFSSDIVFIVEDENFFRQGPSDFLKQHLEQQGFEKESWNGFSIYYKLQN